MRTSSGRCRPARRPGRWAEARRAALALALALGADAQAQAQAQEPAGIATLERVVVTGSNLARPDAEDALPVQVIRRAEIERSGVQTVQELVGRISASFGGGNEATGVGDTNSPGFSGASLRGLGSRSTLVLLNGRRLANYAFSSETGIGVDLHAIPLAAVERVEILKDGASAIYGSDAIAGVINFILREDFRGIEATVERSWTQAGGGAFGRESLTVGIGDRAVQGWNVLAVLDHTRQQALTATDRSFANTAFRPDLGIDRTSPAAFPANIPSAGLVNPASPACTARTVPKGDGCWYDHVKWIDLLPQADNLGLLMRGSVALGTQSTAYVEFSGSRQETRYLSAPTPLGRPFVALLPEDSPYYPAGLGLSGDLVLAYRAEPLGPRVTRITTDQQRTLLGWRGGLAGWDTDAAVMRSTSSSVSHFASGYADGATLADALGTGLVNPFGESGPAGNALLAAASVTGHSREGRGTTSSVDVRATRDLAQLPAGTLALALGAEARSETLDDHATDLNDSVAGGGLLRPSSGSRRAQSIFAELALPLLPTLDSQLALRADHYSDFGTSTNPKVALRWQPTPALVLRASAGTGFRAPSLPELYAAQSAIVLPVGLPDPKRCPVTDLESDCSVEVPVQLGGNPALNPETSRQLSAGLVFEPVKGVSIGLDWWRLALKNTITSLSSDTVLDGNDRYEGKNIVRGPPDPAYPGLPGPIVALVQINENIGRLSASGIDADLRLRSGATPYGRFSAELVGSYLTEWRVAFDGVNEVSLLGTYQIPRWQHTLTLGWERGPWAATLVQLWRAAADDANPPGAPPRRIAASQVWDAQVAWTGIADMTLVLGVKNLFDRDPPTSNQIDHFQVGYYPEAADPRGRAWYLRAGYRWR